MVFVVGWFSGYSDPLYRFCMVFWSFWVGIEFLRAVLGLCFRPKPPSPGCCYGVGKQREGWGVVFIRGMLVGTGWGMVGFGVVKGGRIVWWFIHSLLQALLFGVGCG